jgi:hypothetical protein
MPAKREIRCEACGTVNRVPQYSFRRIPSCSSGPLRVRPINKHQFQGDADAPPSGPPGVGLAKAPGED